MEALEQEATKILGHAISLASPKQVAQVLFQELSLPLPEDSKQQQGAAKKKSVQLASTSEAVLLKLKDKHPLPDIVLGNYLLLPFEHLTPSPPTQQLPRT